MDLALEFGMPAEQLARQLTEREFAHWVKYAERRMLPARRVEAYLAQITKWIAMTMGGMKNATIADFMLELAPQHDSGDSLAEAKEAFAFQPRGRKG